jgi:hypothetical protein
MDKIITAILAILFLICLADMPYGYFQFVRWAALVGFSLLAYEANENKKENEWIVYIGLAVLFQPIIKIPLGRTLWNIVDVAVALGLLISIWKSQRKQS